MKEKVQTVLHFEIVANYLFIFYLLDFINKKISYI